MPLKRYADFSGRSRRKEYWMFTLGLIIVYALVAVVFGLGADPGSAGASLFSGVGGIILLVLVFGLLIPSLAVQIRRFHDQDKSGWFILLNFIPLVGGADRACDVLHRGDPGTQPLRPGSQRRGSRGYLQLIPRETSSGRGLDLFVGRRAVGLDKQARGPARAPGP